MMYNQLTYKIPEGRMPDILDRFENTTVRLFERHGVELVGFWARPDADELVYLCRFENEAAMEKAWDSFLADPEWLEAQKRTEANGPIVDEVIKKTLIPTSFSPLQ